MFARTVPTPGLLVLLVFSVLADQANAEQMASVTPASEGVYRLPYADGTTVELFDDFMSHRPAGRNDLFGVGGVRPYPVVAAAAGRIMAIEDGYREQQSGRPASECRNNFVWIAHPNGEWTGYSHLAHASVTGKARLRVGDRVKAGTYLGDEGTVGCSMLDHVHFEVAVPRQQMPIDAGGFINDDATGSRLRSPRFCGVADETVRKGKRYRAVSCP